jgi:hypothetical protein
MHKSQNYDNYLKGQMMNLFKKNKCVMPIFILAALSLSGCKLLSSESTQADVNDVNTYSDIKELSAYKKDLEEVLAMRGSINRLVELEQDLTFLLDEMSRFEEQNPNLQFAQRSLNDSDLRPNEQVVFTADGATSTKQLSGMDTSKFDNQNVMESLALSSSPAEERKTLRENRFSEQQNTLRKPELSMVETSAAKKISTDLTRTTSNQVKTNKFSNASSTSNSLIQKNNSIVGPLPAKYSDNCDKITTNISNSFAVHLASYSSQKRAIAAWEKVVSVYSGELCSNIAKTLTVQVNGKIYHRLNVGGYADESSAQSICVALQKRSTYCKVVEFEGDAI